MNTSKNATVGTQRSSQRNVSLLFDKHKRTNSQSPQELSGKMHSSTKLIQSPTDEVIRDSEVSAMSSQMQRANTSTTKLTASQKALFA